jgi:hypothetical protein
MLIAPGRLMFRFNLGRDLVIGAFTCGAEVDVVERRVFLPIFPYPHQTNVAIAMTTSHHNKPRLFLGAAGVGAGLILAESASGDFFKESSGDAGLLACARRMAMKVTVAIIAKEAIIEIAFNLILLCRKT